MTSQAAGQSLLRGGPGWASVIASGCSPDFSSPPLSRLLYSECALVVTPLSCPGLERRPHRARHCWSRSGTTRVGAEETQPTNTEAWWLTAASGQVPSGLPGKRPCVPDPSGVLPTKLPSSGETKPLPPSSLQTHSNSGAESSSPNPQPLRRKDFFCFGHWEWQVEYRKSKRWTLSSEDLEILKNVSGGKNPNKQNTKYIYLETVKKKLAFFFFIVLFVSRLMTSHVEVGGVSPSFLLILVKMDGGALSSVSMPPPQSHRPDELKTALCGGTDYTWGWRAKRNWLKREFFLAVGWSAVTFPRTQSSVQNIPQICR